MSLKQLLLYVLVNILIPGLILAGVVWWNWRLGGWEEVKAGFKSAFGQFVFVLPGIVIAFGISGQVNRLAVRYDAQVKEYLAGKHGVWGAFAASVFAPSMTSFDLMQDKWKAGEVSLGIAMIVIIGARLLNFQNLLFFLPVMGGALTVYAMGFGLLIMACFMPLASMITFKAAGTMAAKVVPPVAKV